MLTSKGEREGENEGETKEGRRLIEYIHRKGGRGRTARTMTKTRIRRMREREREESSLGEVKGMMGELAFASLYICLIY